MPRRVALVHHWLVRRRGGEKVLETLARMLPGASLFTLVHDPARCPAPPGVSRVVTSGLQRVPGLRRGGFRALAPLLARFYGGLDLSGHDLVVSSDAALAKTVRVPDGVPHLCVCYSPPRWAWDLRDTYLERSVPRPLRPLARAGLSAVRRADAEGARGVTRFVAISEHVAERIARAYGREADVIHPPVDTAFFTPAIDAEQARHDLDAVLAASNTGSTSEQGAAQGAAARPAHGSPADGAETRGSALREHPYLLLGEAVTYKRFEDAVDACARLDRPLVVAGGGPRWRDLVRRAGPRTRFVPRPTDTQVRTLYRGARALLFPGEEDFGLVPVEAMACGTPVIGLGRGGLVETVVDGETGVLYDAPGSAPLAAAMTRFEAHTRTSTPFDQSTLARHAGNFSTEVHIRLMQAVLESM